MGLAAMTRGAIRWQIPLVLVARVVRLSAGAVNWLGEHRGAGRLPSGAHTAGGDAWLAALDLDHHPARAGPRPGLEWVEWQRRPGGPLSA
jgi:hypothetical protein